MLLFGDLLVLFYNSLQWIDDQQVGSHASYLRRVRSLLRSRSHLLSCARQTDQKFGQARAVSFQNI